MAVWTWLRGAIGMDTPATMVTTHAIALVAVIVLTVLGVSGAAFLAPLFMLGIIVGVFRMIPTVERFWPLSSGM